MPKNVNGEEYVNLTEAQSLLGMSKQLWYNNVKPHLPVYRFDGRRKPFYRKRDVLALRDGKKVRKAFVVAPGSQKLWSDPMKERGCNVATVDYASPKIMAIPEELACISGLAEGTEVVKRMRLNRVDEETLALFITYYPLHLVQGEILERMLRDDQTDAGRMLQDTNNVKIVRAVDVLSTRLATPEEQEALHIGEEIVSVLHRVSFAGDNSVILVQEIVMILNCFSFRYEYSASHWL